MPSRQLRALSYALAIAALAGRPAAAQVGNSLYATSPTVTVRFTGAETAQFSDVFARYVPDEPDGTDADQASEATSDGGLNAAPAGGAARDEAVA